MSPPGRRFECGKGVVLREGRDVAIVASGAVVGHAVTAANALAGEGIDAAVLNIHTLKPIDEDLLASWGDRTGALLTVEDHGIVGGLGSAVCEALAERGVPIRRHGVREFGESGSGEALYAKHGLDAAGIARETRRFVADLRGARGTQKASGTTRRG